MPTFNSAEERRRATEHLNAMLQRSKAAQVVEAVRVAPRNFMPRPKPVKVVPEQDRGLLDWNDPEEIAALHMGMDQSDVDTGRRNRMAREEHLRKNGTRLRAEYERRCEQDEARIRKCPVDGPFINDARAAWWPPAPMR